MNAEGQGASPHSGLKWCVCGGDGWGKCPQLFMPTQKMQVDPKSNVNKMPDDKSAGGKSIYSLPRLSGKIFFNDLILNYFHSDLDRES